MKVIGKMTGLRLLEEITNNNISCGTMIRYKRDDLILLSNPSKPVYEYYKFTKGDGRFHRCDEHGRLGAKGQNRFMRYAILKQEFEIVEIIEEKKDIQELKNKRFTRNQKQIAGKINELVREVNKLKNNK
jgi:hypothetical protein